MVTTYPAFANRKKGSINARISLYVDIHQTMFDIHVSPQSVAPSLAQSVSVILPDVSMNDLNTQSSESEEYVHARYTKTQQSGGRGRRAELRSKYRADQSKKRHYYVSGESFYSLYPVRPTLIPPRIRTVQVQTTIAVARTRRPSTRITAPSNSSVPSTTFLQRPSTMALTDWITSWPTLMEKRRRAYQSGSEKFRLNYPDYRSMVRRKF